MRLLQSFRSGQLLLVVSGLLLAAEVRADRSGITPFPGAELIEHQEAGDVASHDWVLGSVERIRGATRVSNELRARGSREQATYLLPSGVGLEEAIDHYREALRAEGTELFDCRGRDCGRSNLWANQIYGQAILYGSDRDQYYISINRPSEPYGELLSVYVVQRGNRRVYAHVDHLELAAPLIVDTAPLVVERLQRRGHAVIADVPHDFRGELPSEVVDRISRLTDKMQGFRMRELSLTCHVYGAAPVLELKERSLACAEQARAALDPDGELDIQVYGLGPLAPRGGQAHSRLELILPYRLSRD